MDMNYTPGPWQHITHGGEYIVKGSNGQRVLSIRDGVIPMLPDAALLETASQLLDVLHEFCQDVQAGGPNIKEEWPDLYVTYQHAQAAIAKATIRSKQ